MKLITILNTVSAVALIACMTACEPKKTQEDSAEVAMEKNDSTLNDRDDEKDADFVVNTVAGNYAEIKLAQLALNKSNDSKVKEMATKLEEDHTKILNDLKAYADKHGIAVPMEETEDATKDMNDLAAKEANEFDEKWCEMLEDKHEKTINKFEARMDKTEDPELKNWISATLPALKNHHEMLKQHEDTMK
jgi:putative membrane protein